MNRSLASALAALALLAAAPASAQTPGAAAQPGLAVADVAAWLTSKGGEVSAPQRDGDQTYLTVKDGPITWAIFFHGCTGDVCADIQYSAAFENPTATLEAVNAWNTQQRFLKAFYVPGEAGAAASAAVQYDVLLQPGGVEQLNDPTAVWVGLLPQFAVRVGGMVATPAVTPPAP